MKKFSTCLFIILISSLNYNQAFSQPTTWAQPGAHWYYTAGDGVQGTGYYELWEEGDTIINGITCDIIKSYSTGILLGTIGGWNYSDPDIYTYQQNDTVYCYYQNQFHVLFVKSIQPGQTWITGPSIENFCIGDTIEADSVMSVTINSITMNRIVPVMATFSWPAIDPQIYFHSPIYERFGATGFFLPAPMCITDISYGPLRCYSDSAGFFYMANITPTCDYITSVSEPDGLLFSIFPNPATNRLHVFTGNRNIKTEFFLEIFNADGKFVDAYEINDEQKTIDISKFSSGLYIVKIKNRPRLKPVRFVKL